MSLPRIALAVVAAASLSACVATAPTIGSLPRAAQYRDCAKAPLRQGFRFAGHGGKQRSRQP